MQMDIDILSSHLSQFRKLCFIIYKNSMGSVPLEDSDLNRNEPELSV